VWARAVARVLDRYLLFSGRLARLPFFARGVFLGVATAALAMVSIPFFSQRSLWWWVGILDVMGAIALFGAGTASLIVRRLHDLGFSGYHAIWVGAAEAGWGVLSYGPPQVMLAGLPFVAICAWLTFGERPA
jgi:uncharacterized membrane protein YhaH (DUF805 family)